MRMPFSEFITSGDVKFIVAFFSFCLWVGYHFFKKIQARKHQDTINMIQYHNTKIQKATFWIMTLSVLSLLLGLLHSFYFIGKSGGIAPSLVFQGISYTLITPVLGISLFICCKILKEVFNTVPTK